MLRSPRRRLLRAQLRDNYVLLKQFRFSLLFFAVLVGVGTLLFWLLYEQPADHTRLTLSQSVFAAFSLIFFQTGNVPYPDNLLLDLLYYLVPICGLLIVGESVVRFGVQLFNKELRKEEWNVSLASTYSKHVVVCGAGHVGFRVIEQLVQLGEDVVAVEGNRNSLFADRVRDGMRIPWIVGDARKLETLKQAGVDRALAVIPCTSNDLVNLEIALNARELNPDIRVVMRMFEPELAAKLSKGFGLGTAFSTAALAAPAFAAAVRQHEVQQALYVDDTLVTLSPLDVQAGSPWVGKTVGQVQQELDISLVLHKRDGQVDFRPDHGIVLKARDHLIIFATLDGIIRAKKMNEAALG
jgi:voltage-gated potassium channel